MRITGMSNTYDNNKINAVRREIPQVNPSAGIDTEDGQVRVKQQPAPAKTESGAEKERESRQLPDKREVLDYALNSDLIADKNIIGSESDIRLLDVEKAVSSMKRDSILQNYQYFVGNVSTEDGIVTRK